MESGVAVVPTTYPSPYQEWLKAWMLFVLLLTSLIFEVRGVYGSGLLMVFPVLFLCDAVFKSVERAVRGEGMAATVLTGVQCICMIGVGFGCMVTDGEILWQLLLIVGITVVSLAAGVSIRFFRDFM